MYEQPTASVSIWEKALDFVISPAYAEKSPSERLLQRNREINIFNRWLSNIHGIKKPSLDSYGNVPDEHRCYVFSTQYIQEIESAYREVGELEYAIIKALQKMVNLKLLA